MASILSKTQVKDIFETVFFPGSAANLTIGPEDERKAELFLKELIQGSCRMSAVEGLFRKSFAINPNILSIIGEVARRYAINCSAARNQGKFYISVRDNLRRNMRSAYEIRRQTGEW